jgi:hypothetical protein
MRWVVVSRRDKKREEGRGDVGIRIGGMLGVMLQTGLIRDSALFKGSAAYYLIIHDTYIRTSHER